MRLNFWQWLGVILLLLGTAVWLYERKGGKPPKTDTAPVVQPTR